MFPNLITANLTIIFFLPESNPGFLSHSQSSSNCTVRTHVKAFITSWKLFINSSFVSYLDFHGVLHRLCSVFSSTGILVKWLFLHSGVYSQSYNSCLYPASHRQQTNPNYKNSLTWYSAQQSFWGGFFKASRVLARLTDHSTQHINHFILLLFEGKKYMCICR